MTNSALNTLLYLPVRRDNMNSMRPYLIGCFIKGNLKGESVVVSILPSCMEADDGGHDCP